MRRKAFPFGKQKVCPFLDGGYIEFSQHNQTNLDVIPQAQYTKPPLKRVLKIKSLTVIPLDEGDTV